METQTQVLPLEFNGSTMVQFHDNQSSSGHVRENNKSMFKKKTIIKYSILMLVSIMFRVIDEYYLLWDIEYHHIRLLGQSPSYVSMRTVINDIVYCLWVALVNWWSTLLGFIFVMVSEKTFFALFPFAIIFLVVRYADHFVHNIFYDDKRHVNTTESPRLVTDIGKKGVKFINILAILITVFMYQDFKIPVFLIEGTVYVSCVKRFIKRNIDKLKLDISLRPPNEDYDHEKKFYGGLPSGHMAQSAFCMFVCAHNSSSSQIPLIYIFQNVICAAYLVMSNRHFSSQLVAGVALGYIFSLAST
eukprot:TRINITY_DN9831_c0_g1_i1.p1 TRINITY_DN9831_c0_g1~~TRINITY_DN9831_c0_g1_i1.p1  ORF type:complete len:317 (-),score=40.76 TRINITY_DN9831_c0_g1_i1:63-968(-)